MLLTKEVRKIRYLYNALISQRSLSLSQSHLQHNKAFQKFKLKQARMQCADDVPIYLKNGTRDKIVFNSLAALILYNTFQSICALKELIKGP